MMGPRTFITDRSGSSAAEFAMVLPAVLLGLFAIIDAGGYAWAFNKAEKATQVGARWAAVTDMVPSGLATYDFAIDGGVLQGEPVPLSKFPGISCISTSTAGSSVTCTYLPGGTPSWSISTVAADATTFRAIVDQMRRVKQNVGYTNVEVIYQNSGLGFSGNPDSATVVRPDISPIITVKLRNMTYRPGTLFVLGTAVPLPSASYSLTMEDGQGTIGYH